MKKYCYFLLLLFLGRPLFAAAPSGPAFMEKKKPDAAIYVASIRDGIIKELENTNPAVRKNAVKNVQTVFHIAHRSKEINKEAESDLIKALEKRLADDEKTIRYLAASELLFFDMYYNISTDRSLIINLCIEALNEPMNGGDADLKVIERIINYFGNFKGKLGAKKDGAISALKNHLNNRHKLIRYEAAAALGELDYTNNKNLIMPVFLEALFDVDKDDSISIGARMQILKACRAIGPEAGEALPGLLHVTKDEIKKWGGGLTFLPPISIWTLESVTGLPLSRIIINDVLTYPMVNIFIAFCFCGLFRWSVKLREKGKKVFHWFLPVPVLFYACYCVYNIAAKTNSVFEFMYNYKIFIFLTLVGLIPWLLSWLFCKHSVNPSR